MLEHDLLARDGEPGLGAGVGDVARGDRAVETARFAGLADDHRGQSADAFRHPLRLFPALDVLRLELCPLDFEAGTVVLARADCLLLRQQPVARVAGADPHDVAHLAEILDPLQQDHFDGGHGALLSSRCRAAAPGSGRA